MERNLINFLHHSHRLSSNHIQLLPSVTVEKTIYCSKSHLFFPHRHISISHPHSVLYLQLLPSATHKSQYLKIKGKETSPKPHPPPAILPYFPLSLVCTSLILYSSINHNLAESQQMRISITSLYVQVREL